MSSVRLDTFDPKMGLDRGVPKIVEVLWYLFKMVFFLSSFPWPYFIKQKLLLVFGAKIGKNVIIKPRVNIHFPWKLEIGNNVWIGEEVFILNFEIVVLEDNVCVSQRSFICGGNHDYRDSQFKYLNGPIVLKEGVWIGAGCFLSPNIIVGENCVVTAGSVVTSSLPKDMVCQGNPTRPIKNRWKKK